MPEYKLHFLILYTNVQGINFSYKWFYDAQLYDTGESSMT